MANDGRRATTVKRLAKAALFSAVRAAAGAGGTAAVGLVVWWVRQR
ncbi:hypothetical protein [Kitasatospora sp. NPDC048407]